MYAKYYELRCMFLKIAPRQSWHACLIQHQNSCYFRVRFERRNKLTKKAHIQEN